MKALYTSTEQTVVYYKFLLRISKFGVNNLLALHFWANQWKLNVITMIISYLYVNFWGSQEKLIENTKHFHTVKQANAHLPLDKVLPPYPNTKIVFLGNDHIKGRRIYS